MPMKECYILLAFWVLLLLLSSLGFFYLSYELAPSIWIFFNLLPVQCSHQYQTTCTWYLALISCIATMKLHTCNESAVNNERRWRWRQNWFDACRSQCSLQSSCSLQRLPRQLHFLLERTSRNHIILALLLVLCLMLEVDRPHLLLRVLVLLPLRPPHPSHHLFTSAYGRFRELHTK